MVREIGRVESVLTTDNYVDLIAVELPRHDPANLLLIWLKEENVNAIKYTVFASNDGVTWETVKAETIIAKDGSTWESVSDPWIVVKVLQKASVGGSQGRSTCIISAV